MGYKRCLVPTRNTSTGGGLRALPDRTEEERPFKYTSRVSESMSLNGGPGFEKDGRVARPHVES